MFGESGLQPPLLTQSLSTGKSQSSLCHGLLIVISAWQLAARVSSLVALPHYIPCSYISLSLLLCTIHGAAETERMEGNFHLS